MRLTISIFVLIIGFTACKKDESISQAELDSLVPSDCVWSYDDVFPYDFVRKDQAIQGTIYGFDWITKSGKAEYRSFNNEIELRLFDTDLRNPCASFEPNERRIIFVKLPAVSGKHSLIWDINNPYEFGAFKVNNDTSMGFQVVAGSIDVVNFDTSGNGLIEFYIGLIYQYTLFNGLNGNPYRCGLDTVEGRFKSSLCSDPGYFQYSDSTRVAGSINGNNWEMQSGIAKIVQDSSDTNLELLLSESNLFDSCGNYLYRLTGNIYVEVENFSGSGNSSTYFNQSFNRAHFSFNSNGINRPLEGAIEYNVDANLEKVNGRLRFYSTQTNA